MDATRHSSKFGQVHQAAALLMVCGLCLAFAAEPVLAGGLQGKILDVSGAPIPGARVTAIPDGRTSGTATASSETGEFSLQLADGRYAVTIAAEGFQPTTLNLMAPQSGV